MLNVIYYPVSFILWCWHTVFGFVLGDVSAAGWALAIVFLVFTLRAILLQPAIRQIRSMRAMQRIAPQMTAIRARYAGDRPRQMAEAQRLQREHGVNPLAGCLPVILQVPVFIALNHVLRTFTQHPDQPNYYFPLSDVHSYLAATLFDAHLGDAILNIGLIGGAGAGHTTWMWQVAPVAIPLMVIAAIATHLTARSSAGRTVGTAATGSSQSRLIRTLSLWVFPSGALVFGGVMPVGLLIYWVSNNMWTLGQQHLVVRRMDAKERDSERRTRQRRRALAPRPGQRPEPRRASRH